MSDTSQTTRRSNSQFEDLRHRIIELESIQDEFEETKQRLAAERTFSESIIASLPGLFFMVDDKGLYHRWNKNLEELLGYTTEEIMLRDCRDFVPREDRERIFEAIEIGFKEGSFTLEYSNLTKDGRTIPFCAKGVGVEIGGRPYIIGVELNLSELRKAEKALRESEAHLHSLMETATNFAVYRLAFESGDPKRVKVIFVSPSIIDLLGVKEPMIFENWTENTHPDDSERIMAAHFTLPRPERTEEIMRVFHPHMDEWRWIQFLSTSMFDNDGRLKYSNGIIFDITDRVSATEDLMRKEEELQKQTEKLAKLNTALQVLVEHREMEIRNIENGILNAMERLIKPYLQDLAQSRLSEEQRVYIEIMESNIDKIASPLARKLSAWQRRLSPSENRVADLVRNGKTTKEIASLLGISDNAVSFHRKNIRHKLGLVNQQINLTTYLQSQEPD